MTKVTFLLSKRYYLKTNETSNKLGNKRVATNVADKGLVPRICNKLIHFNKKVITQLKNGQKPVQSYYRRKDYRHMKKVVNLVSNQGNTSFNKR